MSSGSSDPPGSGPKAVRRSPRLSPQVGQLTHTRWSAVGLSSDMAINLLMIISAATNHPLSWSLTSQGFILSDECLTETDEIKCCGVFSVAAVKERRERKEGAACRRWRGEEGWRGAERKRRRWAADWRRWWVYSRPLHVFRDYTE